MQSMMIRCIKPTFHSLAQTQNNLLCSSTLISKRNLSIRILSTFPKQSISSSSHCERAENDSRGKKFPNNVLHRKNENTKKFHSTSYGGAYEVDAEEGKNLLDVAHENNIELEGACGGELACATCHLIFEQRIFDALPEKLPEEDDMLDMAMELTDTSRLGCQICVRKDFSGMKVHIPDDAMPY